MEENNNPEKPIVAICYDFDKTLSPKDMQAQGFIQSVGFDVNDFWKKSNGLAKANGMDQNLAYMFEMSNESTGKEWITQKRLAEYGAKIEFFKGVKDWFNNINMYAEQKNIKLEHYIISSGIKEMIDGTSIAHEFKHIYASAFYYGEHGNALWPAQSVNYTNKTQFLFRIEKGVLDVYDQRVNDHFQPSEMRVPFSNMIYIGDSDTDVPCMKVVNEYGGYSIGVYDPDTCDKTKVFKIYRDGRIKLFAPADYTDGHELDSIVKAIIDKISASQQLDWHYIKCFEENAHDHRTEEEINQDNLIASLEESNNFKRTHEIIQKCIKYKTWSKERVEKLCSIAKNNSQVSLILSDSDEKMFYGKILKDINDCNADCTYVKEQICK